jgi:hypothetical protein
MKSMKNAANVQNAHFQISEMKSKSNYFFKFGLSLFSVPMSGHLWLYFTPGIIFQIGSHRAAQNKRIPVDTPKNDEARKVDAVTYK